MTHANRIDLHIHTTHSDGSVPPRAVMEMAKQAGVAAMAITDHDITTALPEAMVVGQTLGIRVIPGVEISSRCGDGELHILGYFFDWQDPLLLARLTQLRESRHARNPQIVNKLRELGYDVSYDEVLRLAGAASVGRPHIARLLVQKGFVTSAKEAFDRFLGHGKPAYMPRELPDPATAIRWIRDAKGVPVLAHPTWAPVSGAALTELVRTLKDNGLGGIEAVYSTHKPKQTGEFLALAKTLELVPTGGSDFHGTTKPDIDIGVGRGDLHVPLSFLDPLQAAAA
ncbi:MAG: PHP domain-containing protein [Nitrospiraceae bacterium]